MRLPGSYIDAQAASVRGWSLRSSREVYGFRTIVNAKADPVTGAEHGYAPNYLDETPGWTSGFYQKGSLKAQRRLTFR